MQNKYLAKNIIKYYKNITDEYKTNVTAIEKIDLLQRN